MGSTARAHPKRSTKRRCHERTEHGCRGRAGRRRAWCRDGGNAARVVELEIGTAPPPPRVEVVPEPREGFIYERGHYEWDGQRYVWVEGKFIEKREDHKWRPYVLEPRGEKWHFRAGHWDDDRPIAPSREERRRFQRGIRRQRARQSPGFFVRPPQRPTESRSSMLCLSSNNPDHGSPRFRSNGSTVVKRKSAGYALSSCRHPSGIDTGAPASPRGE